VNEKKEGSKGGGGKLREGQNKKEAEIVKATIFFWRAQLRRMGEGDIWGGTKKGGIKKRVDGSANYESDSHGNPKRVIKGKVNAKKGKKFTSKEGGPSGDG